MRGVLLSLAFAFVLAGAAPSTGPTRAFAPTGPAVAAAAPPVFALQIPDKTIDITVNNRGGGVAWYRSPVWIAIGILAAIVVLLLIVLVARGGGTTIVRD